jgi:hypothetical protein
VVKGQRYPNSTWQCIDPAKGVKTGVSIGGLPASLNCVCGATGPAVLKTASGGATITLTNTGMIFTASQDYMRITFTFGMVMGTSGLAAASGTSQLCMGADGNLVLFGPKGLAYWAQVPWGPGASFGNGAMNSASVIRPLSNGGNTKSPLFPLLYGSSGGKLYESNPAQTSTVTLFVPPPPPGWSNGSPSKQPPNYSGVQTYTG